MLGQGRPLPIQPHSSQWLTFSFPQILNLLLLAALTGCSVFYYFPAYQSGTIWHDIGSRTHLVGTIASGVAFFLFLILMCCGRGNDGVRPLRSVLAILTLIVAAIDVACWITSAVSGTTSYLCDGALLVANAAEASAPTTDWIQCKAPWMKYAIYALIGLSAIFQAGAVFGALPCWAKVAAAPLAVAAPLAELGKSSSSRRRRQRSRRGGAGGGGGRSQGGRGDEEAHVPLRDRSWGDFSDEEEEEKRGKMTGRR